MAARDRRHTDDRSSISCSSLPSSLHFLGMNTLSGHVTGWPDYKSFAFFSTSLWTYTFPSQADNKSFLPRMRKRLTWAASSFLLQAFTLAVWRTFWKLFFSILLVTLWSCKILLELLSANAWWSRVGEERDRHKAGERQRHKRKFSYKTVIMEIFIVIPVRRQSLGWM